jgi:adenine C2-methylase RlmN of 23S rRNA A2503 and tRNA A37
MNKVAKDQIAFKTLDLRDVRFDRSSFTKELSQSEHALLAAPVTNVSATSAYVFGDNDDGVIEFAAVLDGDRAVEVGYYFGKQKPKSIIKISPQIGCPFHCNFCNAGEEVFQRNVTAREMYEQAALMLKIAAFEGVPWSPLPHKVNFAGTGEPLLNSQLVPALEMLAAHDLSFKISTVFPGNEGAFKNFERLAAFAGGYSGSVQIQVSLISTDADFRAQAAGGRLASFEEIVEAARLWRASSPHRAQLNLSLILTDETPAEAERMRATFPPDLFRIRFRNYVSTEFGEKNQLEVLSKQRLSEIKNGFRLQGYDVKDDATPTATEQAFSLASNVTRRRMMRELGLPIAFKK